MVLCRAFLRNRRVRTSELKPEELLSEIWQKLLGAVSMDDDLTPEIATEWSVDLGAPERDGRVEWLIKEIGGAEAIAHRYEDILRERFGRSLPGGGRRIVQPPGIENEFNEPGSDPDQPDPLQQKDAYRAWRGLLVMADQQFPLDDDVSMLLRLMNKFRDILEESSTSQWPITRMVTLLNAHFSPPPWSNDRVDNAKKRLVNWTKRLMRNSGLDAISLEDLFARVASRKEGGKRASLMPPSQRYRLM
jgi:hypothetical protein